MRFSLTSRRTAVASKGRSGAKLLALSLAIDSSFFHLSIVTARSVVKATAYARRAELPAEGWSVGVGVPRREADDRPEMLWIGEAPRTETPKTGRRLPLFSQVPARYHWECTDGARADLIKIKLRQ